MDVPALHLVIDDEVDEPDNSPTMMDSVETYLRLNAAMPWLGPRCLTGMTAKTDNLFLRTNW